MIPIVRDYGKDIEWSIGSLFAHDDFILKLLDILKGLRYENPIKYTFGSIPCLFQGGRLAPRNASIPNACKIIDEYNKRGVGCRLTFSNSFITEEHLNDEICNGLLMHLDKKGSKLNNGVLVSSDILATYIRKTYPNLQIISSLVKPSVEVGLGNNMDTVDYYNKLFDLYDLVTVNPMRAIDQKFVNEIKYPDRVEFIANHKCVPNCPCAKIHYETQMKMEMKSLTSKDLDEYVVTLGEISKKCFKTKEKYPFAGTTLSQSNIEYLLRMGFTQFKIEGREASTGVFARDLGSYIFENYMFVRIASSLLGEFI